MDLITKIFDLDFSVLVPELTGFLAFIRTLLILAVLAGPVAMLALGGMYLNKPAPEANYKYGFRTYFGMGSVEAWSFSQRIAGLVFGVLGTVLTVIMLIVTLCKLGKDPIAMADTAVACLCWELGLALAARLGVAIAVGVFFDRDGNRRR